MEELISQKIFEMINYILSKLIKPDITIDKVEELTEIEIEKLKKDYGIEGVILDVDDTLRKDMKNIPECNKNWINKLKGQLKVIILTNGIDKNLERYFLENGINYIGFAHKPLKFNFLRACKMMKLEPNKVAVIGDSLFDDIYGGNKNKMKTILVKSVEDEDEIFIKWLPLDRCNHFFFWKISTWILTLLKYSYIIPIIE